MQELLNNDEELDALIEAHANAYVTNLMTKKEWREAWGHLNPLAYATVPVHKMDKRKYACSKD